MEKFSSIEEELLYVNKEEEEQRLKNTDVNIARQEGELASKRETIKNSAKLGLTAMQIADLVNMSEKEIIKIQEELALNAPVEK